MTRTKFVSSLWSIEIARAAFCCWPLVAALRKYISSFIFSINRCASCLIWEIYFEFEVSPVCWNEFSRQWIKMYFYSINKNILAKTRFSTINKNTYFYFISKNSTVYVYYVLRMFSTKASLVFQRVSIFFNKISFVLRDYYKCICNYISIESYLNKSWGCETIRWVTLIERL